MNFFEALLLGIVQGLTEFFPVSSSAHLKLVQYLLHLESAKEEPIFELFCHFGTLFALLFALRRSIYDLFTQKRDKLALIAISILPLFPIYFFLKPVRVAASNPHFLGLFLIVTGVLLFSTQWFQERTVQSVSFVKRTKDALWIGTLQSAALIPGISRSASTISCAKALGWSAREAVQYSFLLAIPTVMGGNILELTKLYFSKNSAISFSFSSCLIGFLSSLGVGMAIVRPALGVLEKGHFKPFAWYCIVIGIATTLYLM